MTPAYLLGRSDNVLVPTDDALGPLINAAMMYVEGQLGFETPLFGHDVRVTRIDLVRNLMFEDDSDIDAFIRGQAKSRPKWAKMNRVYVGDVGARGVDKGNKSRSVRVYDTFEESKGACVPGLFRWEAWLAMGTPSDLGNGTLPDLTPDSIEAARSAMWGWSRMDDEIIVGSGLPEALRMKMDSGDATLGEAKSVLHEAVLGGHGGSPSTRNRNREIMRRLGLTADTENGNSALQHILRVDYSTGRVTRV
jgi:hypothetical protein